MNVYLIEPDQFEDLNCENPDFIRVEPILITKGEYSGKYFLTEDNFQNPHCCHLSKDSYQIVVIESINDLI